MTALKDAYADYLPAGQKWFTAKEAAHVLGKSPQYVRNCFDSGRIMGHCMGSGEERHTYMIPRHALELYLAETANYCTEDLAARVLRLAKCLSPELRLQLASRLSAMPCR